MYFCKKSKLGLGDAAGDIHRVTIGDITRDVNKNQENEDWTSNLQLSI